MQQYFRNIPKKSYSASWNYLICRHWRKAFDLRDYLPTSEDKARFIKECEPVKWNKAPPARKPDDSDDDRKSNKKTKFGKSEKSATKCGQKTDTESGPKYCTHCKTDTHNMERYWKLKKIAREKELSEKMHRTQNGLSARKLTLLRPGPVRNAISKLLRRLSSASRASTEKKKTNTRKWPMPKRLSLATSDFSNKSIHVMEPRVKGSLARKDLRSRLSDLTLKEIKLTSKL
jgi:hypothetical protein